MAKTITEIDLVITAIERYLEKHNLKLAFKISFPIYRQLPDEVKLAMSVLKKNGMKISFLIEPTK